MSSNRDSQKKKENTKSAFVKFLCDIGIIALAVVLYSPGLVALRISDESILRAGLSVIMIPVLVYLFFYVNYFADRNREARERILEEKANKERKQEISDMDSLEEAVKVFSALDSSAFEKEISSNLHVLEKTKNEISVIKSVTSENFGNGSLTYAKFSGATEETVNAIVSNSRMMAKRISLSDECPEPEVRKSVRKLANQNDSLYHILRKLNAAIILSEEGESGEKESAKINELIDELKYYSESHNGNQNIG